MEPGSYFSHLLAHLMKLLSRQKIADTDATMIKSPAKYFALTGLLVICFATYSESAKTPRRNLEPEDTHNLFEHAATNETAAEMCERRGKQGKCVCQILTSFVLL